MNRRIFGLIATRLAIIALIVIAVLVGRDALVKRLLISQSQGWIGAKVEVGHLRSDFREGEIQLRDLAIADPRDPMNNLLQAESAVLKVDLEKLARKQLVIRGGNVSRVMFAAPRTLSGRLENDRNVRQGQPAAKQPLKLNFETSHAMEEWLDRFQQKPLTGGNENLKFANVSTQVFDRWKQDLQRYQQKLGKLKVNVREIHDLVSLDSNPLRSNHLQKAESILTTLNNEIHEVATGLATLDQRVIEDRDLLDEFKSKDEERLVSRTSLSKLNGATLSALLLRDYQLQQTRQILSWYLGFREMIPDPQTDFLSRVTRGQSWPINGLEQGPGLLIQEIQLDGEGRLAGHSFNFSGTAKNISSDQTAGQGPAVIELRAQGRAHAFVEFTHFGRSDDRRDRLNISCPALNLPSRILGDPRTLTVNVSPSRTNVDVNLSCDDGQLEGSIRFNHSNLVLQIQQLDDDAGGYEMAQRINLELASISDFAVTSQVSGSMDEPFVQIESDLGDRLASKFNEVMGDNSMTAENQIRQLYESGIKKLNLEIAEEIRRLSQQLQDEIVKQKTQVAKELSERQNRDSLNRRLIR